MEFYNPVRLILGSGVREKIVEECIGKSVLIFCTASAFKRHKQDHALTALVAQPNIIFEHAFDSNPSLSDIVEISRKYRNNSIDLIIGLGGGSSMDTAKGCNFILSNGGRMSDYWGIGKASQSMLPFIAIPTTAGTGSECQSFALISEDQTNKKMACGDKKALPKITILDIR